MPRSSWAAPARTASTWWPASLPHLWTGGCAPARSSRRPRRWSVAAGEAATRWPEPAARAFSERLGQAVPVPVELYDERLTTRLAARTGGRASEDSRAAAHLLEGWLAAQTRAPDGGRA